MNLHILDVCKYYYKKKNYILLSLFYCSKLLVSKICKAYFNII